MSKKEKRRFEEVTGFDSSGLRERVRPPLRSESAGANPCGDFSRGGARKLAFDGVGEDSVCHKAIRDCKPRSLANCTRQKESKLPEPEETP
jgi:hypothetical protein